MAENLKLVVLHDTNRNEDVLPITHEDAVLDADGKSVGTKFTELEGEVKDSITDYFIICRKENFSGWGYGNYNTGTTDYPLSAGVTYELIYENTATIYFRWWDENNTQNTPISNRAVTGPFIYEFTPEVNVVKWNISSSSTNTFTIRTKNLNRSVILKTDVVNNLTDGGTDVPLSAEQGKVLSNDVGTLNTCYVPLCRRNLNLGNRGYAAYSYTNASAIFKNTGFKKLSVKDGYKYILSSQNYGYYKSNDVLHSIIGTYTTDDWLNTSSEDWLWINIQRVDGESIPGNELCEILSIEDSSSADAFKNINSVDDVYKIGKKYNVTFNIIQGEGINDQGGITTNAAYTRTDYVDVRGLSALIFQLITTYDTVQHAPKTSIIWYNENKEKISTSLYVTKRGDTQCVIPIPQFAAYMSLYVTGGTPNNAIAIKKKNNLIDALYDDASTSPIGHLKKVSFILVYGQSLGNGSDSVGISNSPLYYPLRMLNGYNPSSLGDKTFQHLVCPASSFEYPDRGCGEMFVEAIAKENNLSAYSNEWENHLIVFANCAAGSNTIAQLTTERYSYVETAITNVKSLCDELGYTMEAPAWVWNQGEQDVKAQMSSSDYKTALLALQDKYCNSLQTIAGITKRPKCVIYQPACQCLYSQTYNYANPYLEFMNAYVDLLKDNNEFIASAPVYIFDMSDSGGRFIHLNARSYKMLGAYAGYAIKKAVIDKINVKGVIPLTITVSGTTITIKYNVPCPPLKFDTEWVKETPLVNGVHTYGFNVVKSDDTELISSVSVFDDTVTIVCTESPIGAKLRYGLNGDRIKIVASDYWGVDGRIYGGRGNLRDSQGDYVQKQIREFRQTMRLDNWAYCFEKVLEEAG